MGWEVAGEMDAAEAAAAAGADVVLVAAPGAPVDLARLRAAGPGRVALLVADLDDPATRPAAVEMASELFARPRDGGQGRRGG